MSLGRVASNSVGFKSAVSLVKFYRTGESGSTVAIAKVRHTSVYSPKKLVG